MKNHNFINIKERQTEDKECTFQPNLGASKSPLRKSKHNFNKFLKDSSPQS